MIIRRATANDAPACASIVSQWLDTIDWMPAAPSRATLEKALRDGLPLREAWVADAGDTVQGYLSLDPETAHIHGLYTAAPGAGVGHALMTHVKQGRDYLQLHTHAPNTAAHRFYAREGFVITDRPVAGDDGVPQYAMDWTR